MIVITLTSCPPKLRGDLSKWLCEINTGVYVGNFSARVREKLWLRICENLENGKATMVYSSNSEQHMEFRVHNGEWTPTDFDGVTLMKRPVTQMEGKAEFENKSVYRSKAGNAYRSNIRKTKNKEQLQIDNEDKIEYIVVDIETTGLNAREDEIIELAAIKIAQGKEVDSFSRLIKIQKILPDKITELTGITQDMLEQGEDIKEALKDFLEFIGKEKIIAHNLSFDMTFLQNKCRKCGYQLISNANEDTIKTAKKVLEDVRDYKLETLASYFGLGKQRHRALDDCRLLFNVYEKMRGIEMEE